MSVPEITSGVDANGIAKLADFGLACPMRLEERIQISERTKQKSVGSEIENQESNSPQNFNSVFDMSGFPTPDAGVGLKVLKDELDLMLDCGKKDAVVRIRQSFGKVVES